MSDAQENGLTRATTPEQLLAQLLGVRTGAARRILQAASTHSHHVDNGLAVLGIRDRSTLAAQPRTASPTERAAAHLFR